MKEILHSERLLIPAQIIGPVTRLMPVITLLGGCSGVQSALDPHGPAARSIAHISWVMFIGATAILVLVMTLALIAVFRAPYRRWSVSERVFIIGGGILFPVVTLSVLLAYGIWQMRDLRAEQTAAPVHIEVIGHQWWWEAHYLDQNGARIATTANELHIPAGVPVSVAVQTRDVIHSFWVPNLAGKIDLIPGRRNHIRIQADEPGVHRGQCAEYCGAQHARMGFYVVVQPQQAYQAWLEAQARPAEVPAGHQARQGRDVFLTHCMSCHTVRGVAESNERAPDLTHIASRRWLGAGVLENNRENLLRWIAHNDQVKPGNRMPTFSHLETHELEAVATFLEGLR